MAFNLALAFQFFAIVVSVLGLTTLCVVLKLNERRGHHGRKTSLLSSILIAIGLRSPASERTDEESFVIIASTVASNYGTLDTASSTEPNLTGSYHTTAGSARTVSFDLPGVDLQMEGAIDVEISGARERRHHVDARKRVTMMESDEATYGQTVVPHSGSSAILLDDLMAIELIDDTPLLLDPTPKGQTRTGKLNYRSQSRKLRRRSRSTAPSYIAALPPSAFVTPFPGFQGYRYLCQSVEEVDDAVSEVGRAERQVGRRIGREEWIVW